MILPISRTRPNVASRLSRAHSASVRERALERLYERKAMVDSLIESLEEYQRDQQARRAAVCIEFSARPKCSSDSARWQI